MHLQCVGTTSWHLEGVRSPTGTDNSAEMLISPHSRSRRKYKHWGNRAVMAGRKFKDPNVCPQMVVTEDSDNVWYQLPSSHKKQKRQEHCLKKDIDLNRSTGRKHWYLLSKSHSYLSIVVRVIFCFKALSRLKTSILRNKKQDRIILSHRRTHSVTSRAPSRS